jgi:hypothetical protein
MEFRHLRYFIAVAEEGTPAMFRRHAMVSTADQRAAIEATG